MTAFRTLLTILLLTSQTLWAAPGKLQNTDFKTPAQLSAAGAPLSQLLNDSKIWVTANGINQQLSSAITSGLIGGGAGTNLVSNGSFEASGVAGWSTFQTTLAAAPSLAPTTAPATCSACTFAIGAQTSGALDGATSLQLTGATTTTAGQGFISNAFSVAPAFRGQVMSVKGVFSVVSGLVALNLSGTSSNSFAVYIYDVTNAAWIQPNGTYAFASNGGLFAPVSFQVPTNTTQLQLAIVNVNTLTGATVQLFDDLTVAPGSSGSGPAYADLKLVANPVITATTTAPTRPTSGVTETYRVGQRGDEAHFVWTYQSTVTTGSAVGSGDYLFSLPAGMSFDLNKVIPTGGAAFPTAFIATNGFGTAQLSDGTSNFLGQIIPYDATRFRIAGLYNSGTSGKQGVFNSAVFPFGQSAVQKFSFDFTAPIAGWSSNVTQSSDFDGRNVNFTGYSSGGSVTSNVAIPLTAQPGQDKAGAWNGSAYVVQAAGDYLVSGSGVFGTAGPALTVYLNGSIAPTNPYFSTVSAANAVSSGSTLLQNLKVGDQITLRLPSNSGYANLTMSVMRMPGSSPVIQSATSINASYANTAGTSFPSGASTLIPFATKVWDSANAWTGTAYVCPTAGKYRVNPQLYTSVSLTTAQSMNLYVYLNGAQYRMINQIWGNGNAGTFYSPGGSTLVACNQGDSISFYLFNGASGAAPLSTLAGFNHVSIDRVGN